MKNMQLLLVGKKLRIIVLCFLLIMSPISAINGGSSYDTIVIGGGIAGIKAAVDIANSGQKVAVLQANDYLGGRMLSKDVTLQTGGNLKFDEGASWIHGNSQQHPITKLALDVEGLITADTNDDLIAVRDTSGNDVTTTSQTQNTRYRNINGQFSSLDPSISIQRAITNQDSSALSNYLFMFNIANNVQFETSGSIDKLSASGYNDGKFTGTERLILSGYQKFVQTLSKKATFEIFLSHKVKKVVYNSPRMVNQIVLENGVTVYATHVVIAVPIGVLKAGGITFEPEFPSSKKQAISSIGFGNVCKILLDFTGSSFFTQTQQYHYVGVADSDVTKRGLATYFLNLKPLANIPALMTFGLGANADEAESMSDADLKTLLVNRLNAFATITLTASDFNVHRTSWRSKQNFQGTYSYASTSTRSYHWDDMAKTISQTRWYFCGEHTYVKYRGTVHGAYLSGQKAATQVIENQKARISLIIGLSVMGGVLLIAAIVGGICLYKHLKNKKQTQIKQSSQIIQN